MSNGLLFTADQVRELRGLSRREPRGCVRIRALAVLHVARGATFPEAGRAAGLTREAVSGWCRRYLAEGAAGLSTRKGAGRPSGVDAAEVEGCLRRSPRAFGIPRTRWTLASLAVAAPSLKGMGPSGVFRVLRRLGLSHKRGQPRLHSPDPLYGEKKGGSRTPSQGA